MPTYTYSSDQRFNQFMQPGSLNFAGNPGGIPWSLFGMSAATMYGMPLTSRVPSYVRSPLQRLVYMLPRYYYNQRQDLIGQEMYEAAGGSSGLGSYGETVLSLPRVEPTGLSNKALKKWRKAHYFDVDQAIKVPSYGVNRPLVRGSRDDPAGVRIPPRFLWADSLRT